MSKTIWLRQAGTTLLVLFVISCSGLQEDICHCAPSQPDSADFRFAEKHIPLPSGPATEITVNTMLGWPQQPVPANDSARTGRELQLFHIATAFVQAVWLQPTDCDIHMEISQTADKSAPRVIIETPRDSEYCPARQQEQSFIAAHGVELQQRQQAVAQPFAISVLGLAFEDFAHHRGSSHVATLWELHPAIAQAK